MKWFRSTTFAFILVTLGLATTIAALIISMCTDSDKVKHMDYDPSYNGTLGIYIVIVVIQFLFISVLLYGLFLAFKNWKNNFQLDHIGRRRFILWLSSMLLIALANVSVAVFAIVRGKEPQKEMAYLYDVFAQTNKDTIFVKAFEKYQKDKSCCGVYGPDDWLMVQLRSGMGGGGGGGGFQSLDYGFQQNPSTGHCHLTPPVIPMGCGKKMIEAIHFTLSAFAGIMIFETVVALVTASFAGYCFYYWLDKEVIVIPEDEVSNLIIMEAESSTSDNDDSPDQRYSNSSPRGGSRESYRSNPPHYSNYPSSPVPSEHYVQPTSRATHFSGSYRGSASRRDSADYRGSPDYRGSTDYRGSNDRRPTGYLRSLAPFNSNAVMPKIIESTAAGNHNGSGNSAASQPIPSLPGDTAGLALDTSRFSRASPYGSVDNSRFKSGGLMDRNRGSYSYQAPTQHTFYQPFYPGGTQLTYPGSPPSQLIYPGTGSQRPSFPGSRIPTGNPIAGTSRVTKKQEKMLGGKILGEMHVDHNKDNDTTRETINRNEAGQDHPHHPTIAIVRNKKPPKLKSLFASN